MNNTKEHLQLLCKLQNINIQQHQLLFELKNIPSKVNCIKNEIKQDENNLKTEKSSLSCLKNECVKIERSIDDCTTSISKSKSKLSQIKSNKEYQSALEEINALNIKQSDLEDSMLQCLEELDILKTSVNNKKKLALIRKEIFFKKETDILNQKILGEKLLEKLKKEAENVRSKISAKILLIFDNTFRRVKNKPIAPVSNSVCLGCNLSIPPQLYNELQRFEKLKFCPHCKRIVYWKEKT